MVLGTYSNDHEVLTVTKINTVSNIVAFSGGDSHSLFITADVATAPPSSASLGGGGNAIQDGSLPGKTLSGGGGSGGAIDGYEGGKGGSGIVLLKYSTGYTYIDNSLYYCNIEPSIFYKSLSITATNLYGSKTEDLHFIRTTRNHLEIEQETQEYTENFIPSYDIIFSEENTTITCNVNKEFEIVYDPLEFSSKADCNLIIPNSNLGITYHIIIKSDHYYIYQIKEFGTLPRPVLTNENTPYFYSIDDKYLNPITHKIEFTNVFTNTEPILNKFLPITLSTTDTEFVTENDLIYSYIEPTYKQFNTTDPAITLSFNVDFSSFNSNCNEIGPYYQIDDNQYNVIYAFKHNDSGYNIKFEDKYNNCNLEVLVVGGGGGGGLGTATMPGNGGSGGEVIYSNITIDSSKTYNIVVGDGGDSAGENSSFDNIIANGGAGATNETITSDIFYVNNVRTFTEFNFKVEGVGYSNIEEKLFTNLNCNFDSPVPSIGAGSTTKDPSIGKYEETNSNFYTIYNNITIGDYDSDKIYLGGGGKYGYYEQTVLSRSVYSCGRHSSGQLGRTVNNNNAIPVEIDVLANSNIVAISSGEFHSLFLDNDGNVYSCGDNDKDQLGRVINNDNNIPIIIDTYSNLDSLIDKPNIVAISSYDKYSLALDENGYVYSWGEGYYGVLGLGDISNHNRPTRIDTFNDADDTPLDTIPTIVAISAGAHNARQSLFLDNLGSVYSCGKYNDGQLGHGDTESYYYPTRIDNFKDLDGSPIATPVIVAISAGAKHSLFLDENGYVYSCGYGNSGRLGHGDTVHKYFPTRINTLSNIVAISAGSQHSLFLDNNRNVYSCGYVGLYGILGRTVNNNNTIPIEITNTIGDLNIVAISASAEHSLFLDENGYIYACGKNYWGQLGNGKSYAINSNDYTELTITKINALSNIVAFSISRDHSLFITADVATAPPSSASLGGGGNAIQDGSLPGKTLSGGGGSGGAIDGFEGGKGGSGIVLLKYSTGYKYYQTEYHCNIEPTIFYKSLSITATNLYGSNIEDLYFIRTTHQNLTIPDLGITIPTIEFANPTDESNIENNYTIVYDPLETSSNDGTKIIVKNNNQGLNYHLIVKDENHYYIYNITESGETEVVLTNENNYFNIIKDYDTSFKIEYNDIFTYKLPILNSILQPVEISNITDQNGRSLTDALGYTNNSLFSYVPKSYRQFNTIKIQDNNTNLNEINNIDLDLYNSSCNEIGPYYSINSANEYNIVYVFKYNELTNTDSSNTTYSITFGEDYTNVDLLIVGGGGGGGSGLDLYGAGGGGTGGILHNTNITLHKNVEYQIIVGNGGDGNTNGYDSMFYLNNENYALAKGGGKGGSHNSAPGSGGGGSGNPDYKNGSLVSDYNCNIGDFSGLNSYQNVGNDADIDYITYFCNFRVKDKINDGIIWIKNHIEGATTENGKFNELDKNNNYYIIKLTSPYGNSYTDIIISTVYSISSDTNAIKISHGLMTLYYHTFKWNDSNYYLSQDTSYYPEQNNNERFWRIDINNTISYTINGSNYTNNFLILKSSQEPIELTTIAYSSKDNTNQQYHTMHLQRSVKHFKIFGTNFDDDTDIVMSHIEANSWTELAEIDFIEDKLDHFVSLNKNKTFNIFGTKYGTVTLFSNSEKDETDINTYFNTYNWTDTNQMFNTFLFMIIEGNFGTSAYTEIMIAQLAFRGVNNTVTGSTGGNGSSSDFVYEINSTVLDFDGGIGKSNIDTTSIENGLDYTGSGGSGNSGKGGSGLVVLKYNTGMQFVDQEEDYNIYNLFTGIYKSIKVYSSETAHKTLDFINIDFKTRITEDLTTDFNGITASIPIITFDAETPVSNIDIGEDFTIIYPQNHSEYLTKDNNLLKVKNNYNNETYYIVLELNRTNTAYIYSIIEPSEFTGPVLRNTDIYFNLVEDSIINKTTHRIEFNNIFKNNSGTDDITIISVSPEDKFSYSNNMIYSYIKPDNGNEINNEIITYEYDITNINIPMITSRENRSMIAIGTDIYIFGGFNSTSAYLNDFYKIDIINCNIVYSNNDLTGITRRWGHSMVAIGTDIYIYGGYGYLQGRTFSPVSLNDFYKIDTFTCNIVYSNNDLSGISARRGHSMVAIGTDIYIYGGESVNNTVLNDFYKIDTNDCNVVYSNNDLTNITKRYDHSMVSINNDIYIYGGNDNTVLNDFYKIDTFTCNVVYNNNDLSGISARKEHSMVAIGSNIYVYGGRSDISYTSFNDFYEIDTNDCNIVYSNNDLTNITKRYNHSMVSINNDIYIFGGNDNSDQLNDFYKIYEKTNIIYENVEESYYSNIFTEDSPYYTEITIKASNSQRESLEETLRFIKLGYDGLTVSNLDVPSYENSFNN